MIYNITNAPHSTSRIGTDTEEKDCQEINHVTYAQVEEVTGHNYWNNNDNNNTIQLKNER